MENNLEIRNKIVTELKSIYDPDIPVNIYDLGLIYAINIDNFLRVEINMTLTSPNCPVVDNLVQEVYNKIKAISEIKEVVVNIVFDPPWNINMMSEEARLELDM